MKGIESKRGIVIALVVVSGIAICLVQLLRGGQIRANISDEPAVDATSTTRVIAEHPAVELIEERDDHTRV